MKQTRIVTNAIFIEEARRMEVFTNWSDSALDELYYRLRHIEEYTREHIDLDLIELENEYHNLTRDELIAELDLQADNWRERLDDAENAYSQDLANVFIDVTDRSAFVVYDVKPSGDGKYLVNTVTFIVSV